MRIKEEHRIIVEERGYEYIGTYNKGEYTIDKNKLMEWSEYIRVKCYYCGVDYDVTISSFKNGVNCSHCCNKYDNSFAYHIQQELKEPLNKYWDWDKNTVNPYLIYRSSSKQKVWIKCAEVKYHESHYTSCNNFLESKRCPYCSGRKVHPRDSFAQNVIDKFGRNYFEKLWNNGNKFNPWEITPQSNRKVILNCIEKEYHKPYTVVAGDYSGNNGGGCPYCSHASGKVHSKDSFAQYHIDNTDPNFLEKYWSDKNTLNPWELAPNCTKKIFIKCQEVEYHDDYKTTCSHFTVGTRCPQCTNHHGNVHPRDSFGALYPEKAKCWSDKNNKTSFEVSSGSRIKYWFKCEKCGKEFKRCIVDVIKSYNGTKCKIHAENKFKGEQKIKEYLENSKFIKNEDYEFQKEFNGLVGLGYGNLSYDFYLPKYNLLIEYQGEFHDGTARIQTEKEFKCQQEHDKRKREYATDNNIELLEIWYWDFDNIDEILKNKLQ